MKKTKIHTHYDNLKVSSNASDSEIRSAYRRLSKKYHPDYNQGNEEATRIMQLVNKAYAVLSDPIQRKAHDEWINQQKILYYQATGKNYDTYKSSKQQIKERLADKLSVIIDSIEGIFHRRLFYQILLIIVIVFIVIYLLAPSERLPEDNTINTVNAVSHESVSLDTLLNKPDIQLQSGRYVQGYPLLLGEGTHTLRVQSKNSQGVLFVQIYSRNQDTVGALRTIVLPPNTKMELEKFPVGEYFARYYVLPHGKWQQSSLAHLAIRGNTYLLPLH